MFLWWTKQVQVGGGAKKNKKRYQYFFKKGVFKGGAQCCQGGDQNFFVPPLNKSPRTPLQRLRLKLKSMNRLLRTILLLVSPVLGGCMKASCCLMDANFLQIVEGKVLTWCKHYQRRLRGGGGTTRRPSGQIGRNVTLISQNVSKIIFLKNLSGGTHFLLPIPRGAVSTFRHKNFLILYHLLYRKTF